MKSVKIKVLERIRFANSQPVYTDRWFNDDFSIDKFICPYCKCEVDITHWKDKRGVWPDLDLPCKKCGKHWGILI